MLKQFFTVFIFCILVLNADDAFPFIKPLSVEHSTYKASIEVQTVPKKVIVAKKVEEIVSVEASKPEKIAEEPLNLNVTFASKQYMVTPELVNELEEFSIFLKKNKSYQVILYGYTDSIGEKEDNKLLSQRRANAVKEALIQNGVNTIRLTAIGRGESNPIADNMYEEGRSQNRRIEAEFIK